MSYSSEIDRFGIEGYLSRYRDRDMLRLLTCGSVDDGKSTLIGRLLHDSQMVFDDVLSAVKKDSAKYGTTVKALRTANGLRTDSIKVGQKLTIPGSASVPTAAPVVPVEPAPMTPAAPPQQ